MGKLDGNQLKANDLTGANFNSEIGVYDETANYVTGETKFWKHKLYKANNNVSGGVREDLTNAPDISTVWDEVPINFNNELFIDAEVGLENGHTWFDTWEHCKTYIETEDPTASENWIVNLGVGTFTQAGSWFEIAENVSVIGKGEVSVIDTPVRLSGYLEKVKISANNIGSDGAVRYNSNGAIFKNSLINTTTYSPTIVTGIVCTTYNSSCENIKMNLNANIADVEFRGISIANADFDVRGVNIVFGGSQIDTAIKYIMRCTGTGDILTGNVVSNYSDDENWKKEESTGRVVLGDIIDRYVEKIYYDEIPVPIQTGYPLTNIQGILERFAPKLANIGSEYAYWFTNTIFMYINTTTNEETKGLKFADDTAMIDWVNDNVANNGSNFTERGYFINYDIVDTNITPITKAQGFNSAFGALSGGKYKSHKGNASETQWSDSFGMLAKVFNDMFGLGTTIQAVDFKTVNNLKSIWLAQNAKRYNQSLVHTNSSKTIIDYGAIGSIRWCYNNDWMSPGFEAISSSSDPVWNMTKVFWVVASFDKSPSYNVYDRSNNSSKQEAVALMKLGRRGLVVYGYESASDSNKKGILLKPMGIDCVTINNIDFNKYQLEILQKATGEQQNFDRIKVISSTGDLASGGLGYDEPTGRLTLIPEDYYFDLQKGYSKTVSYGGIGEPKIYFRLRDKETFKISKISRAYIKNINLSKSGGIIPYGRIVRTDKQ